MRVYADTTFEEVCKIIEPRKTRAVYGITEWYGFGKYIRQYGYYPQRWPLHIHSEHSGPTTSVPFTSADFNNSRGNCIFFHSPYSVAKWKETYDIPVHGLYSPFVFFRKKYGITQSPDAKGTLAYPAHSIPGLDVIMPEEHYIRQLKALPEEFQPVSISIHYHDIKLGKHKIYLEHGLDVYCAGYPDDYAYPQKFYNILRQFRYTTSNYLGSYVFYAVEMGIPFFLLGDEPDFADTSNTDGGRETFEVAKANPETTIKLRSAFSTISRSVTPAQRELIEYHLGILDHNSRLKMSLLLYKYLLISIPRTLIYKLKLLFPVTFKQKVKRLIGWKSS